MLANFLTPMPAPSCGLLLARRHFRADFSFNLLVPRKLLMAWNSAVFETPAFLFAIAVPLCCQSVFGYIAGNFFLTWNHLFVTNILFLVHHSLIYSSQILGIGYSCLWMKDCSSCPLKEYLRTWKILKINEERNGKQVIKQYRHTILFCKQKKKYGKDWK